VKQGLGRKLLERPTHGRIFKVGGILLDIEDVIFVLLVLGVGDLEGRVQLGHDLNDSL